MIFQTSVLGTLFVFTPGSWKVPTNVSRCSKGLLSSATVLVSALLIPFGRSVTVSVWNGLSQFTHHGLLRLTFYVMVVYVVLSCTTCGHVLVRLRGLLKSVATKKSNLIAVKEPLLRQGFFLV